MRRMPAAIDDSLIILMMPILPVLATCVPPHSHGAHFAGFGDRHVAVLVESHGHAHALVGQALYLGDFFGGELLEV